MSLQPLLPRLPRSCGSPSLGAPSVGSHPTGSGGLAHAGDTHTRVCHSETPENCTTTAPPVLGTEEVSKILPDQRQGCVPMETGVGRPPPARSEQDPAARQTCQELAALAACRNLLVITRGAAADAGSQK